jgi:hypothetical protein
MKPCIVIFLMIVCIFLIHGGCVGAGAPRDSQGASSTDAIEVTGTVVYVNLEGGFFAIHGDDGSKYNPINLPEAFRKDGLKIKALVRPRPDVMSIHMAGSIVEIIGIRAQKYK